MKIIVSTIETVPCSISKYLVEIIQPTFNKNKPCFITSYIFEQEPKAWEIG